MKRQVLPLERVREELARYVPVEINLARDDKYARRYQVIGAPTFLLLDAQGQVKDARVGPVSAEAFIRFLQGTSASSRSPGSESG
jgi:hypothetical protein